MYMSINGLACSMSLLKRLCPAVCGLLVLLKTDLDSEGLQDRPPERVLYLRLEQTPAWAQQDFIRKQDAFTRCACIFWRGNEKKTERVCLISSLSLLFSVTESFCFFFLKVYCYMCNVVTVGEHMCGYDIQRCCRWQVVFSVCFSVSVCVLRELLLRMMCGTKLFVCFKAKDLLRTALRHFSRDLSWKQGDAYEGPLSLTKQLPCYVEKDSNSQINGLKKKKTEGKQWVIKKLSENFKYCSIMFYNTVLYSNINIFYPLFLSQSFVKANL